MKRKVLWVICAVVIVVALAAMLIFVFSGKDNTKSTSVDITGTWKVVAYINNSTIDIVDNEFMVFDSGKVVAYREGSEFLSSTYTINAALLMELPDISRKYTVDQITDNYVCLYENQNIYIELIRYPNADMKALSIDTAKIIGQWNIIYRNTDKVYKGDYLLFEEDTISQFSASSNSIVAVASYSWQEGNHLIVDDWGKDMVVYPLSDTDIILVELSTESGFIWELQKSE